MKRILDSQNIKYNVTEPLLKERKEGAKRRVIKLMYLSRICRKMFTFLLNLY